MSVSRLESGGGPGGYLAANRLACARRRRPVGQRGQADEYAIETLRLRVDGAPVPWIDPAKFVYTRHHTKVPGAQGPRCSINDNIRSRSSIPSIEASSSKHTCSRHTYAVALISN